MKRASILLVILLTGCQANMSQTLKTLEGQAAADQTAANQIATAAGDAAMEQCTGQLAKIYAVAAVGPGSAAVQAYEVQQAGLTSCAGVVAQEKASLGMLSALFAAIGL